MRKDEVYHKIFLCFWKHLWYSYLTWHKQSGTKTLYDEDSVCYISCWYKILPNVLFSSPFFRYVFWHLLQLVSCPISTICVRFSVHRALLPKLKPLYSAFNTSALSITILSIVTSWHILGMDGNVCNALKTKLNLVTNFNPKIISDKFLTS